MSVPPSPSGSPDPVADLRRMSNAELAKVAEDGLRAHLAEQAVFAHRKHGPVTAANLEVLLQDSDCVRYPLRLIYEFGEMALHQFAQPDVDPRDPSGASRVIYLRPCLRSRPDLVVDAVIYMLPVVNYGDVVTDDHCLLYGATLLGLTVEEYYRRVCALADHVGSEPRWPTPDGSTPGAPSAG